MSALLKKTRGLSLVTGRKLDDGIWSKYHRITMKPEKAVEILQPSVDLGDGYVVRQHSNRALHGMIETLKDSIENNVTQQATAFSSAFSCSEKKRRSSQPAVEISSHNSAVLKEEARKLSLAQGYSSSHEGAQTMASIPNPVQGRGGRVQTKDALLDVSNMGQSAAKALPSSGNGLLPLIKTPKQSVATPPTSLPLKGILKHGDRVETAPLPNAGEIGRSDIRAYFKSMDGHAAQTPGPGQSSDTYRELRKTPITNPRGRAVNLAHTERHDVVDMCHGKYKNVTCVEIHQEFEEIRERRRKKEQSKTQAREFHPRGEHPHCNYRPRSKKDKQYKSPVRGRSCERINPHEVRKASEWGSTPAEDEEKYSLPKGGHSTQEMKKVTFVESVVTRVEEVDDWWEDEYGLSHHYHARGPFHKSKDPSTRANDDTQILSMGGISKTLSSSLRLATSNSIKNSMHDPSQSRQRPGERELRRRNRLKPVALIKRAFASDQTGLPILEINEATAEADLKHERFIEFPVEERLALHIAAGEAKKKEWWDSLCKSHAARKVEEMLASHIATNEAKKKAWWGALYNSHETRLAASGPEIPMLDAEDDVEMSDPEEDTVMLG